MASKTAAVATNAASERLAWNIDILLEMVADDIEIANDIAQADYYNMVMALRSHAPAARPYRVMASGKIIDPQEDFDNHPFYGQRTPAANGGTSHADYMAEYNLYWSAPHRHFSRDRGDLVPCFDPFCMGGIQ